MRETEADLARLQDLLDSSYEAAGTHLRRIITPERRQRHPPARRGAGGDCPRESGAGRRPGRGGRRATQTLLEIYVPRYGPEWEKFLDSGPVFWRIEAERMFTFTA
ncbi:MAG TPA: hypothetical protein VMS60_07295 [Solirubrobacterales bacterium]|nr:hypothetical protein [Solirubrobacterales bacterium]